MVYFNLDVGTIYPGSSLAGRLNCAVAIEGCRLTVRVVGKCRFIRELSASYNDAGKSWQESFEKPIC